MSLKNRLDDLRRRLDGSASRRARQGDKLTDLQRHTPAQPAPRVDDGKVLLDLRGGEIERRDPKGRYQAFRPRIKPPNAVFGVVFTTVQLLVFAGLLLGVAGMGAVIGIAKAYVDTTPVLDVDKIRHQALSSHIYAGDGTLITDYTGLENREWATIDEIPQYLQDAIISIEDSRFLSHNGVDVKRIVGSFLNNMSDSSGGGGGSTLTQQLIKNTLLTSERTYKRKIQEAWLSMQLETKYTKEQILESYLNTIPMGQGNYGVKAAAKDYFGKELKDLTLRECSMLAGLTRSPYTYDPRRNTYSRSRMDITNKRTNTVLMRMYELGYIDETQYESALTATVTIQRANSHTQMYDMPYFVEYAMYDIKRHMLISRGLDQTGQNMDKMDDELRTGGYNIHLTVDPQIQHIAQEQMYAYKGYPKMKVKNQQTKSIQDGTGSVITIDEPQAATAVIDYHSGEIKAIVGGRQEPTTRLTLNRAYQSRVSVGSAIKPIAVYTPAFDMGVASPATVMPNVPAPITGWGGKGYPGGQKYTGTMPIREAVKKSVNIVAARVLMEKVGIDNSAAYLNKMGINDSDAKINRDGPGLALGTSGIGPLLMAGAFGTLGNKGEYLEPLSFSTITDSVGNVVLDANAVRTRTQVFQSGAAWMMIDVLKDAVSGGTGSRANLRSYTTAGKTGTHSEGRSVTFSGLTGYYACSVWIGHDDYYPMFSAWGGDNAAPLFKNIMLAIHEAKSLPNKDIIEDDPKSLGLVSGTVCGVSGLKPTDACSQDPLFKPVTDWFMPGTVPGDSCNMHYDKKVCSVTQKLATPWCPADEVQQGSVLVIPKDSIFRKLPAEELYKYFPTAVLDFPDVDNLENLTPDNPAYAPAFCDYHTELWAQNKANFDALSAQASTLVDDVRYRVTQMGSALNIDHINNLRDKTIAVDALTATKFVPPVDPAQVYTQLQAAYMDLQNYANAVLVIATPPPVDQPTPPPEEQATDANAVVTQVPVTGQ